MNLQDNLYRSVCNMVNEMVDEPVNPDDIDTAHKSMLELGISSLDVVMLLVNIEEKYHVQFDYTVNNIEEIVIFLVKMGVNC